MPGAKYNSIQNPRQYRALRRRGYSKEAAARISNARTPGHTVKATRITGNLFRGEGGKFQAGSGGGASDTPKPEAPKEDTQPKPDRAAEREAALAKEEEIRAAEDAAIDAEPNAKKRQAMRRANAVNRRKRAAERRATDRANREADRAERTAAQDAKRQAAEQAKLDEAAKPKEEKPKKGGGGGGGAKPKPTDDEKAQAQREKRTQTARATAAQVGLPDGATDLLTTARDTGGVSDPRLQNMGLVGPDGLATDQGRRALQALESGNVGGYRAAVQDARQKLEREATARTRQAERERRQAERDTEKPDPKKRTSDTPVEGARQRSNRYGQLVTRISRRRQAQQRQPILKSFAVFKSTTGQDCWACITTSAYEDRDTEIITRKGLAFLVETAKATGNLGTLNYWHTPLVLGDCTFQALSDDGLFLIEAGTFRTKAAAELGRRMTRKGWRMSPGFLRPATEPYSAIVNGRHVGLYDHPTIFERSPCPPGRASNLYTPFIAKEARAVTEEQIRMLKSMAPELADTLLAQVETQKAQASAANAVFKGDTAESLPLLTDDTGQCYTVKEGKLVALKAMPMVEAKADMPPAEMIEAGTTELDDGLADEGLEMDDGPLLAPADIQAIAAAVLEAITPIFDIQKQIGELKSALGGVPATKQAAIVAQPAIPATAQTIVPAPQPAVQVVETVKQVSPLEAIQAQVAELQATVKALKGDLPEAASSRPTQSADTVVSADSQLLAGYKGVGVGDSPEEKVKAFLAGFPGFNGNGMLG